ncbi:unnamed protein product [Meganyctiphanes norvegica]|uniref:Ig-like domain-containing protein n=1 Tax=Meganyctiphanes norvegica TaxID=48144 RepID=A0AAV2R505_MEGNR
MELQYLSPLTLLVRVLLLSQGSRPGMCRMTRSSGYYDNVVHGDGIGSHTFEDHRRRPMGADNTGERNRPVPWGPTVPGPIFDPSPPRNVTAFKDDNAFLHCIVHNLSDKTVSWIREKDLHILTVGPYTYTADDRFSVIQNQEDAASWVLKIKSVQPRDSGRYDCQVNTHPTNPISYSIWLSVFVPTARIEGNREIYVDRGSTINLTCIINHNPESRTETFWYHNNKVINYDSRDSRVSVITDRGAVTKTILLIHDAHDGATGSYSCIPSPSAVASVTVHILNGEMPAGLQTNGGRRINSGFMSLISLTYLTLPYFILMIITDKVHLANCI